MINIPKPFVVKTRPRTRIMRKILLLIFGLVSLANVTVNAQNNLRNGYIITNQNDTIYGQLDYRANNPNYHSCIFRKNNKIEKYLPEQIKGYGFVNDKYYSAGILKNAFVEVLVSGTINLYKFDGTYYVSKNGGTVFKLERKEVKTYINGIEFMKEDSHWRGILSYLIADCFSNPLDQIDRMNLNEHELDNLVIAYNSCRNKKFNIYKKDKPWSHLQYGGVLGVSLTSLQGRNTRGLSYYYVNDHYSSVDPDMGLSFLISFPKVSERVSIQPEAHFSMTNYSALKVVDLVSLISYYDTYIHFTTFGFPVALNYKIPWKKNAVFVELGVNYQIHFQTLSKLERETVVNHVVNTYPDRQAFKINHSSIRMFGGIGYSRTFKKIILSARVRYYPTTLANLYGLNTSSQLVNFSVVILKK